MTTNPDQCTRALLFMPTYPTNCLYVNALSLMLQVMFLCHKNLIDFAGGKGIG